MDEEEKRVLRRRKVALAEIIHLSRPVLEELKTQGVLTEDMLVQIESERHDSGKVSKLVELVVASSEPCAFSAFCFALAKKYSWLMKDLQVDLRVEKGDFVLDDDLLQESSMLVHRKFGTSKRLSESDKREISEMIALKLQITREEFQHEHENVKNALQIEKCKTRSQNSQCRQIVKTIGGFVKLNEVQLTTHAHDLTTTSQHWNSSLQTNTDLLATIGDGLVKLLTRFEGILQHRECILRERNTCLKLLNIPDEMMHLDKAIAAALKGNNMMAESIGKDIGEMERTIRRLNKKVTELDNKLMEQEDDIRRLTMINAEKEDHIDSLNHHIASINKQYSNQNNTGPHAQKNEQTKKTVKSN